MIPGLRAVSYSKPKVQGLQSAPIRPMKAETRMPQLTILHPTPNQVVKVGQSFSVGGLATDKGMPEPISIDSVTIAVDNGPLIQAPLKVIPHQILTTVSFEIVVQTPTVLGPHTIVVTATNGNGISAKQT